MKPYVDERRRFDNKKSILNIPETTQVTPSACNMCIAVSKPQS